MTQRGRPPEPSIVRRRNAGGPRRENAPINRRRPATTVPDVLFGIASMLWTMALVFLIASFVDGNVTAGDAGRVLARMFAGALLIAGLFIGALGFALLRDDRQKVDHYTVPIALGAIAGALEAWLFLVPAGQWLPFPPILLIFTFRPLRHAISRSFGAR
ncbi:MAG: hypothetical protein IT303_12910 [Dehalococcoidia bacterium]|nr:hypothetical protein [Dehalococcoidia bacterium]